MQDNLVTTWRQIVTRGGTEPLAPHIRALNEAVDRRYQSHQIPEWQNGKNAPDPKTINHMMDIVLGHILREHGLDSVAIAEVKRKTYIAKGE